MFASVSTLNTHKINYDTIQRSTPDMRRRSIENVSGAIQKTAPPVIKNPILRRLHGRVKCCIVEWLVRKFKEKRKSNQGQIRVKSGSNQGQTRVKPGSNQGQTRVKPGSNQGQIRVKSGSNQGHIRVKSGSNQTLFRTSCASCPMNIYILCLNFVNVYIMSSSRHTKVIT